MLRLLIKWGLSGAALMFLAYLLPDRKSVV